MLKKLLNFFAKIASLINVLVQNIFTPSKKKEKTILLNNNTDTNTKQIKQNKITNQIIEKTETDEQYTKSRKVLMPHKKTPTVSVLGMKICKNKKGQIIVLETNAINNPLNFHKNDIITKINNIDTKEISLNNFENIIIQDKNQEIDIIRNKKKITLNKKDNIKTNIVEEQKEKHIPNKMQEIKKEPIIEKQEIQPIYHKSKSIYKTTIVQNITPKKTKIITLPPQIIIPAIIPLIIKAAKPKEEIKKQNSKEEKKKENKSENKIVVKPIVPVENKTKQIPKENKEKQEQKEKAKTKKEMSPEDEAKLLNKIIEKDIKDKELQVLKSTDKLKSISNLITKDYNDIILPLPLLLFRYRIVSNFFSMITLSNSLTAARNVLNQNQNYYTPNYFIFLSKRKTLDETEFLTLRNLALINNLKEDLIRTYGKQIYTNDNLKEIFDKLDIIEQDLTIKYTKLINNKKQKVKKRTFI